MRKQSHDLVYICKVLRNFSEKDASQLTLNPRNSSFWLLIPDYFTISNIYLMLNVYFCSDPLPACLPCIAGVYNCHTACEVTADTCRRTLIFTDYPDMLSGLAILHQILIFWTVTGPCSRDINATGPCNSNIQATVAVVTLHGRPCSDGHFTLFNSSIPKNPLVSFRSTVIP